MRNTEWKLQFIVVAMGWDYKSLKAYNKIFIGSMGILDKLCVTSSKTEYGQDPSEDPITQDPIALQTSLGKSLTLTISE